MGVLENLAFVGVIFNLNKWLQEICRNVLGVSIDNKISCLMLQVVRLIWNHCQFRKFLIFPAHNYFSTILSLLALKIILHKYTLQCELLLLIKTLCVRVDKKRLCFMDDCFSVTIAHKKIKYMLFLMLLFVVLKTFILYPILNVFYLLQYFFIHFKSTKWYIILNLYGYLIFYIIS